MVGGATGTCADRAARVISQLTDVVYLVSSADAAEATKLYENIFRAVSLALANEFADACGALGLDPVEVTLAAGAKPYGFLGAFPGPGVGGHCIPCDPHYLLWQLDSRQRPAPLIKQAMRSIAERPHRVADRAAELLTAGGVTVAGARVIVVGAAYKAGVQDLRESPALPLMAALRRRGAAVSYRDPLVPVVRLADGQTMAGMPAPDGAAYDLAVIHTLHPGVDYTSVAAFPGCSTAPTSSTACRTAQWSRRQKWRRCQRPAWTPAPRRSFSSSTERHAPRRSRRDPEPRSPGRPRLRGTRGTLGPRGKLRYLRGRWIWQPDAEDVERTLAGLLTLAERIGHRAVLIPTEDAGAIFLAEHGGPLRQAFLFPAPPAGLPARWRASSRCTSCAGRPRRALPSVMMPASLTEAGDLRPAPAIPSSPSSLSRGARPMPGSAARPSSTPLGDLARLWHACERPAPASCCRSSFPRPAPATGSSTDTATSTRSASRPLPVSSSVHIRRTPA